MHSKLNMLYLHIICQHNYTLQQYSFANVEKCPNKILQFEPSFNFRFNFFIRVEFLTSEVFFKLGKLNCFHCGMTTVRSHVAVMKKKIA